jgi:hypothetical protein
MNRLPSRYVSAVVLVVGTALTLPLLAQPRQGTWFSLQSASPSSLRQQIERLVTDVLGQIDGGLSYSVGSPATLAETLASRAPTDLTFVAGRAADIAEFVRTDRFQIVDRLKLEVVNARLGAAPFYLFTNGEKARNLRQPSTAPRVLYASRAGALQPIDVQHLVSTALGIDRQPTVALPLNSPDELARRLFADNGAGGVDVVGIYDEDPSPFLHDFLRAYDLERASPGTRTGDQLVQMLVFPIGTSAEDRNRLQTDRLQPFQGNMAFAFVRYDDLAIESLENVAPRQKDRILAVSATRGENALESLWVLSNVRITVGEQEYQRVRRLVSDAYFLGLMTNSDFHRRCETGQGAQYSAYLVDAQLADRENVAKALAFWSDLVLRSGAGRPSEAARITDQRVLFETVLRQRLNVQMNTNDGRADLVSRLRGRRPTVREQFSDADGSLFGKALEDIEAALRSTDRTVRTTQLAAGRAKLVALVEKGSGPACRGKDLGLFGRGLDPFFYLGLVDAYSALENRTGPNRGAALPVPR